MNHVLDLLKVSRWPKCSGAKVDLLEKATPALHSAILVRRIPCNRHGLDVALFQSFLKITTNKLVALVVDEEGWAAEDSHPVSPSAVGSMTRPGLPIFLSDAPS